MKGAKYWATHNMSALTRMKLACFNTWRALGSSMAVSRALAFKAVLRWQHRHLAACLSSWRSHADEERVLRQIYSWVSFHWEQREARYAFNLWRYQSRHSKASSDTKSISKALRMWTNQSLSKSLNKWRDALEEAKRAQEIMYKALFRWASKNMLNAFTIWRDNAASAYDIEEATMIAAQHFKYTYLSSYTSYWRVVAQVILHRMSNNDYNKGKADTHRNSALLRKWFSAWDDYVVLGKSKPAPAAIVSPKSIVVAPALPAGALTSRIARGVDPYGLFSCIVSRTAYGKQDRALYYVVNVTLEGRTQYELNKRYKDFDLLNSVVFERFRGGQGGIPTLPVKKPGTKLDLEGRVGELHQFLQDLIAVPEIAASEELCEFLQFSAYL